ncbi:MAG: response regulator transcription factor [Elusimicrobiota bacterium]
MDPKILIVDDDAAFRGTVVKVLSMHGFRVVEAATGKAGIAQAAKEKPELIILDLVLPGMRGLDVCQALKQDASMAGTPILILTGNDEEGLEISCLDMGADDYLTKPVRSERLLARIRALLRRPGKTSGGGQALELGPLRLDFERKLVTLGGKQYGHLTPKEFGLLYCLAQCSPQPRDRAKLYEEVWGMEPPSEGSLKTVEVHVRRVRLKLRWTSEDWLKTVSGRGYCLVAPS